MSDSSPQRQNEVTAQRKLRRQALFWQAAILVIGAAIVGGFVYLASRQPTENQAATNSRPGNPLTGNPLTRNQPKKANPRRQLLTPQRDEILDAKFAPSPFRNASNLVEYVGSRACLECHHDEHASYLKTTHSRSLADVDVSREPPDGEFFHKLSGRHYRIYRQEKTLRLREFIQDTNGQEVVLVDYAARFALGSGNYARMYLVQVDDFLIEAPVQWYPRLARWGMSAGYEKTPHQQGFSREIAAGCLDCHTGKVETIGGSELRLNITEMAIGCERCHGPGALHVKERQAAMPVRGSIDDTIVNLRHLSRERQEDVCSQCHLSGSADVDVRDRSRTDFRPGMRLSDFVVSYRIDRPDSAMTVSGQIEQMRLSRCYRESQTMTCASCHNPHSLPPESEKIAYYRNKCLACHQTESCKLSVATRQEQETNDNCIVCHMPRGPTDIPHFSFTHHRVGIHAARHKHEKLTEADQLVPVGDVSHLPEDERRRLLGLANDLFAGKLARGLDDVSIDDPSYRALAKVFENRARQILEDVRSRGPRDAEVETFFSRLNWRRDPDQCIEDAESALKCKHILSATRRSAVYNLASSHFDQQQYAKALPYLEELTKIERSEITLMLLAICHEKEGRLEEAVRLIDAAILDSPDRADLHIYLASIYRKLGNPTEAENHLQLARLLKLKVPQP